MISFAVVVIFASRASYASCYVFEIDRAFRDARAVFVGRVVSTKLIRVGRDSTDVSTVATLLVERRWNGPRTKTLDVRTCGGGDAVCTVGIEFIPGDRYIVFAYGRLFETSVCDTRLVADADKEMLCLNGNPG
jgi:hypothetical protein